MDYTVCITPDNWETFLGTKPLRFAFRQTLSNELNKLKAGDRLVVYLAERMCWSGVFRVAKEAYRTSERIYPSQPAFNVVVEVEKLLLPVSSKYVPIKTPDLWNSLDRFAHVDHTKSGWIYKAKLFRSLCRLSSSDTDKVIEYLRDSAV